MKQKEYGGDRTGGELRTEELGGTKEGLHIVHVDSACLCNCVEAPSDASIKSVPISTNQPGKQKAKTQNATQRVEEWAEEAGREGAEEDHAGKKRLAIRYCQLREEEG